LAPVRNDPRSTPPANAPTVRRQPAATPPARQPAAQGRTQQPDRFEQAHNTASTYTTGVKVLSDGVLATQVQRGSGQRQFGPFNLPGGSERAVVDGVNTRSARWAGGVSTAVSVTQLPGAGYLAYRDTREYFRNPSRATGAAAAGSVAGAASTGLSVASGGLELAGRVSNYRSAARAARTVVTRQAPGASRAAVNSVVRQAARTAVAGGSRQVVRGAAARVASAGLQGVGRTAGTAARAAVHGGGTALARNASRFVPGFNAAIAVADTAVAVSTLADPKATVGKKVTAGITALGSIAAATNIPVVSQAGAVVSTLSSLAGAFL
jgi:hypothetical protein